MRLSASAAVAAVACSLLTGCGGQDERDVRAGVVTLDSAGCLTSTDGLVFDSSDPHPVDFVNTTSQSRTMTLETVSSTPQTVGEDIAVPAGQTVRRVYTLRSGRYRGHCGGEDPVLARTTTIDIQPAG